ncbi:MAG: S8 family serine peptidase [Chitinophagaceae bacterium]
MNKSLVFCSCLLLLSANLFSQNTRYLITFRHKGATSFSIADPTPYLSQRAINRRVKYGITIDSTDLPVPAAWVQEIRSVPNVTVLNSSRWLNTISIQTTDPAALTYINNLPYVQSSQNIAGRSFNHVSKTEEITGEINTAKAQDEGDHYNYGTGSQSEIKIHQGQFLHNIGLRGQGMQIAVLDGGFYQYNTLRAFDSINANGQVLGTWDFVERNSSVSEDHPHGMQCLSTMAANIPGVFTGKSPAASFYLFRTEDVSSEYPIEEFNWACGAERSDSTGADIISSSLGYGYQFSGGFADYPYSNLNGDITVAARAADLAAKKGLLVLNAVGNSGNDYWRGITTPADADSVLAVGAVSTTGVVGSFSSYGPSADGRVKPDIASIGVQAMIQASNNTIVTSNGTSYACPNMAGLASCLWQGFPEVNNMRIVSVLKESASNFSAPDNRIGYGIPDLKKAFVTLLQDYASTSITVTDCKAIIQWSTKDVSAMRYEVERKTSTDAGFKKIGDLAAVSGEQLSSHTYQFTSNLSDQPPGPISYRIRQVVDTSAEELTSLYLGNTLVTAMGSVCADGEFDNMVRLAPNPVTGSTATIIFNNAESLPQMLITVYDMKGTKLMELAAAKATGLYRKDINIAGLAKGKYIIRIIAGNKEIANLDLLRF